MTVASKDVVDFLQSRGGVGHYTTIAQALGVSDDEARKALKGMKEIRHTSHGYWRLASSTATAHPRLSKAKPTRSTRHRRTRRRPKPGAVHVTQWGSDGAYLIHMQNGRKEMAFLGYPVELTVVKSHA
jgi:hypothetical protein